MLNDFDRKCQINRLVSKGKSQTVQVETMKADAVEFSRWRYVDSGQVRVPVTAQLHEQCTCAATDVNNRS